MVNRLKEVRSEGAGSPGQSRRHDSDSGGGKEGGGEVWEEEPGTEEAGTHGQTVPPDTATE